MRAWLLMVLRHRYIDQVRWRGEIAVDEDDLLLQLTLASEIEWPAARCGAPALQPAGRAARGAAAGRPET